VDAPDGGEPVETYAMITTTPNEMMSEIHDRMPVVIDPKDVALWLSPTTEPEALADLMKPFPAERMMATPITTYINKPRNEGERCIQPAPPLTREKGLFGL
jgi:putative SOS response-associated peptidase YedK